MTIHFPMPPPPLLSAPPLQRVSHRVRRIVRSRGGLSGLAQWILEVGLPVFVLAAAAFIVGVVRDGFGESYRTLISMDAPSHHGRYETWVISIVGWLLVPAFVGGFAGHVISSRIEGYKRMLSRPFRKKGWVERLGPPWRISWLGSLYNGTVSDHDFVDVFVRRAHRNDWYRAQDHWEMIVVAFMNSQELAEMGRVDAFVASEGITKVLLRTGSLVGRCPVCAAR